MAINFPNSPTTGDTHTAAGVEWEYDGEKWVSQASGGGGGGGASVTVSDTAPASPSQGDLWWDSSDDAGVLFIWYDDADGGQWVETSGTGQDVPLWTRTGTTLSPATAGDDVFTSGDAKVGNTAAAPNIDLKADGSATFAGKLKSAKYVYGDADVNPNGWGAYITGTDNVNGVLVLRDNRSSSTENALDVSVLGTSKATIAYDGSAAKVGGGSWSAIASARRLKDIVGDVDKDQAWELLKNLDLKRYYFKSEDPADRSPVPWMGLIAEDAAALDPELKVVTDQTDDQGEIWTYNMSVLQQKAWAALSAALTRIEALEAKLAALEGGTN